MERSSEGDRLPEIQNDERRYERLSFAWRRFMGLLTNLRGGSLLKRIASNALIFCTSLLLTVFLGEAAVRVFFHESMDFDMEMWKYATQVKTISNNRQAGHEHLPNREANLMGVEVATNSYGLRDDEVTLAKPDDTYRIVAVGDSITLGWGVRQDQTYPAQLERLLNEDPPGVLLQESRFEVLNLGVGNYNTSQEVARLRDIGLQFEPDLILLGYFINDAEPTPRPKSGFLIENSYLYALAASRSRQLSFANGGALTYRSYYRSLYEEGQSGWEATKAALAELAQIGRERDIPIVVVIIPELHDLSADYPFADIHAQVASVAESEGLPVVDLLPEFQGFTPEEALWVSPGDAHHNAEGQYMIAQGIADALAHEKFAVSIFKEDPK